MSNHSTAVTRLVEAEEHVEVCESHIRLKQQHLADGLARGDDAAELSRLMGLMQQLLLGFRSQRAAAAAEVLSMGHK